MLARLIADPNPRLPPINNISIVLPAAWSRSRTASWPRSRTFSLLISAIVSLTVIPVRELGLFGSTPETNTPRFSPSDRIVSPSFSLGARNTVMRLVGKKCARSSRPTSRVDFPLSARRGGRLRGAGELFDEEFETFALRSRSDRRLYVARSFIAILDIWLDGNGPLPLFCFSGAA